MALNSQIFIFSFLYGLLQNGNKYIWIDSLKKTESELSLASALGRQGTIALHHGKVRYQGVISRSIERTLRLQNPTAGVDQLRTVNALTLNDQLNPQLKAAI